MLQQPLTLAVNLELILGEQDVSLRALAAAIVRDRLTVRSWLTAHARAKATEVMAMAAFLKVGSSDLLDTPDAQEIADFETARATIAERFPSNFSRLCESIGDLDQVAELIDEPTGTVAAWCAGTVSLLPSRLELEDIARKLKIKPAVLVKPVVGAKSSASHTATGIAPPRPEEFMTDAQFKVFRRNLAEWRTRGRHWVTTTQLVDSSGVSLAKITAWTRPKGDVVHPTRSDVVALAKALGCAPADLLIDGPRETLHVEHFSRSA